MTDKRSRGRPKSFHDKTAENTVQSLDRALSILKVVAGSRGLTLTELAQESGQSTPTVYRVLTTLATHGFVETEEPSQVWHIGAGAFRVGSEFLRRTRLAERSRQPMDRLMRATGETANLGIERSNQVLFLGQVETPQTIRAFFAPGTLSPMHSSGIGKAMMAWYPPARVQAIVAGGLDRYTDRTITTPDRLLADLERTRAQGFALDDQERTDGMRCVAAPIFNTYGEAVAGLSVSGPAFRLPRAAAIELGAMVRAAANEVTEATGGRQP
jgi:IclR family acetate operon transcriptional repressor